MRESSDWNLRITLRGLKQCVVIGTIFALSLLVSTPESMWAIAILNLVRLTSFCAALAAPFERALAGACLGLGFFAIWVMANMMVYRDPTPIYRDIRHHSRLERVPSPLSKVVEGKMNRQGTKTQRTKAIDFLCESPRPPRFN